MTANAQRLIIISGLSGAGKSVALHTFEDIGMYCIDNLPMSLLPELAEQIRDGSIQATSEIAIGIDARNPENEIRKLPDIIKSLKQDNLAVELVFIEANDEVLTRRFSETRRKHPLSSKSVSLNEAIRKERKIMEELSEHADIRIDTSHTLLHELRDIVRKRIARRPQATLSIQFISFGFKFGIPRDADFVFDTRCLPNPYWETELRSLNGKDPAVISFLSNKEPVVDMITQIRDYLDFWIPRFESDNRSYLCVALGCTGGQHRSVYMSEQLAGYFRERGKQVIIIHRDMK